MTGFLRSTIHTGIAVVICASGGQAFEFPLSHSAAAGGVSILSNLSPTDMIELPGSRSGHFSIGFESGFLRQYDLGDLDRVFIAAAGAYRRFFGGIGVAQFGKSDLYTEKTVKASLGYSLRDFTIGGSVSAMRIEFGGNYDRFSMATVGLGAGYTKGQFKVHLAADKLTNPRPTPSSEPFGRTGTAIVEWTTPKSLSTVVRASRVEKKAMKYAIGQRIPLARGSALYWGISTRPVEYGGGVDVATRLFTLTYGAKVHPVLGLSHSVSIAVFRVRGQENSVGTTGDGDE